MKKHYPIQVREGEKVERAYLLADTPRDGYKRAMEMFGERLVAFEPRPSLKRVPTYTIYE